jgi:hypothetical protein
VEVGDLKRGFDLDVKNPNKEFVETEHTSAELLAALKKSFQRSTAIVDEIESSL